MMSSPAKASPLSRETGWLEPRSCRRWNMMIGRGKTIPPPFQENWTITVEANRLSTQAPLNPTHQEQHNDNDDYKAQAATWPIAPTSAMPPSWQRANQCQHNDDKKNRPDAHGSAPFSQLAAIDCSFDRLVERLAELLSPFAPFNHFCRDRSFHKALLRNPTCPYI